MVWVEEVKRGAVYLHDGLAGVLDANLAAEAASFQRCVAHLSSVSDLKNGDQ